MLYILELEMIQKKKSSESGQEVSNLKFELSYCQILPSNSYIDSTNCIETVREEHDRFPLFLTASFQFQYKQFKGYNRHIKMECKIKILYTFQIHVREISDFWPF